MLELTHFYYVSYVRVRVWVKFLGRISGKVGIKDVRLPYKREPSLSMIMYNHVRVTLKICLIGISVKYLRTLDGPSIFYNWLLRDNTRLKCLKMILLREYLNSFRVPDLWLILPLSDDVPTAHVKYYLFRNSFLYTWFWDATFKWFVCCDRNNIYHIHYFI